MKAAVRGGGLALALAVAALLPGCERRADPGLVLVGRFDWRPTDDARSHGFSAIELAPDGIAFLALTDRAFLYRGTFERGEDGAIRAVHTRGPEHILSDVGNRLDELGADLEGMALTADGRIFFSNERYDLVIYIDPHTRLTRWVPPHPDFQTFPDNRGFEAVALDPEGRPIAIPEGVHDAGYRFPVYRLDNAGWTKPYALPGDDRYVPVGADTGPDGRLYVLERWYIPWIGFSSRVRSFGFGASGLDDERLILQTPLWTHGNLEGLALSQGPEGALRLTMIADDDGLPGRRTEIVEYMLWPDGDAAS